MPEIDISEIVSDPLFAQSFIVYRKSGTWLRGRFTQTEAPINFYGTIEVNNPKDIMQVPEGDRLTGLISIHTEQPIFTTRNNGDQSGVGSSDEVVYKGERYKVVNVSDWDDFGYYKAIAVRMRGE